MINFLSIKKTQHMNIALRWQIPTLEMGEAMSLMLCEWVLLAWKKFSNEAAYTYSKTAVSKTVQMEEVTSWQTVLDNFKKDLVTAKTEIEKACIDG